MSAIPLPSSTNVVRFPVERRSTLDLLREIAPDAREVLLLADTYHVAMPADLQEQADRGTAEYIFNHAPPSGPARAAFLRNLLNTAVGTALAAVRRSHGLARAAAAARRDLQVAQAAGSSWLADLEQTAADLSADAADAVVAAHARALEALGVARAVDLAFHDEPWTPRNTHAEMDWLLDAEARRQAR